MTFPLAVGFFCIGFAVCVVAGKLPFWERVAVAALVIVGVSLVVAESCGAGALSGWLT